MPRAIASHTAVIALHLTHIVVYRTIAKSLLEI